MNITIYIHYFWHCFQSDTVYVYMQHCVWGKQLNLVYLTVSLKSNFWVQFIYIINALNLSVLLNRVPVEHNKTDFYTLDLDQINKCACVSLINNAFLYPSNCWLTQVVKWVRRAQTMIQGILTLCFKKDC